MTVTPILIIVLAIFFIILVILNHFNVFSLWLQGKFSNANTNVRFFSSYWHAATQGSARSDRRCTHQKLQSTHPN